MDWSEEQKTLGYTSPKKTNVEISERIGYPSPERKNLETLEKTPSQDIKKKIPYGFTFVVLLLGFFNLGSAGYQYYAYDMFSFLEITQGMVGILMVVVSIFLMIKLKVKKTV